MYIRCKSWDLQVFYRPSRWRWTWGKTEADIKPFSFFVQLGPFRVERYPQYDVEE
jgi:hypothetical protein